LLRAPDGGASVCTGGLNLFGLQPISDSCLAYIGRVPSTRTRLKQQVIEGTVQGGIAELPAGDIRFALGGDYRRNSYALTPDADLVAGTIAGSPPTLPSAGAQSVYEGYAEVLLPLIHETPLVKRLDVTLGYRYSRYNRLGGAHTYKADVDWTVVENLKLRGGYSRAIRAPSLADLYAARNTVNVTVGSPLGAGGAATFNGDPCDVRGLYRQGANAAAIKTLCLAQGVPAAQIDSFIYSSTNIVGTNEGNPNLHEEKADTFSVGAVVRSPFSSPWVSGLRASVDYYNIRIKDAVGQLSTATSIARCFNGDGVSNPSFDPANAYCGYIRRDALGNPTQGIIPTLNLASYKTAGVDLQLDWSLDLGNVGVGVNAGRIDLNFAGTLLDEFSVVSLPGAQAQDFAGYTSGAISGGVLPKFRSFTSASYTLGGATLGLRWRHLSSVQDASKVTNPASAIAGVRAYDYFDLFFRGQVSPRFELRGGINNLADKGPPAIGTAPGATDTNSYDVVGRSFFLGVRASF
jgi:outer membrane receptor protein involved in Fe transport